MMKYPVSIMLIFASSFSFAAKCAAPVHAEIHSGDLKCTGSSILTFYEI